MPCSTAFNTDTRLCAANGVWLYRKRQKRGAGGALGEENGFVKAATSPRHAPAAQPLPLAMRPGSPVQQVGAQLVDASVGLILGVVDSHLHALGALFGAKPRLGV